SAGTRPPTTSEARCGNVVARLEEIAALHAGRHALVEYRRGRPDRLTFGELAARVRSAAARLRREGIQPGDRVLLFVPMSIDLYVALLACFHAGAAAVFIDAWAGRERIDTAVRAARPKAFIGTWKAHLLRLSLPSLRRIPVALLAG